MSVKHFRGVTNGKPASVHRLHRYNRQENPGRRCTHIPMNSHVEAVFTSTAATYDAARAMLIPCFDQFYSGAVELLPFESDASIRILDLGAGTGLLAAWVRRQFPKAMLCLLDFSEAMLAQARERLGNELTEYVREDYTTGPLHGSFDAIVSALSIHHLEHPEKQKLFRRIYDALRPGGVFVNAEQVAGPTPELSARYHQVCLAEARRLGATEQMIAEAELRMREDRCASVEEQLGWMRAAGFADADCWFKKGRFAVMAGTRPR